MRARRVKEQRRYHELRARLFRHENRTDKLWRQDKLPAASACTAHDYSSLPRGRGGVQGSRVELCAVRQTEAATATGAKAANPFTRARAAAARRAACLPALQRVPAARSAPTAARARHHAVRRASCYPPSCMPRRASLSLALACPMMAKARYKHGTRYKRALPKCCTPCASLRRNPVSFCCCNCRCLSRRR